MSKKAKLISKLLSKSEAKNFTIRELDSLMVQCGCRKFEGGRGSGIGYIHEKTQRIIQFDGPHPGNKLYGYHVKMIIKFLREVGEIE